MDLTQLRKEAHEFLGVGSYPDPPALDMQILWKRKFESYEEWKIEYQVETAETMSAEAGRRVPAYLLIPRQSNGGPYPAVIAFHQCALNCTIGKDAVVGKVPWTYEFSDLDPDNPDIRIGADRSDQAYGHDLVHQGFAVLAPDSINCGERNIESIREDGLTRPCWNHIDDALDRPWNAKATYDATRAVDLLESLDLVDSERIGAVGHSMGAGYVCRVMIVDKRVKAGIASGYASDEHGKFLPLVSPRLLVTLIGTFDGYDAYQKAESWQRETSVAYAADDAIENSVLLTGPVGHRFEDTLKWQAYGHLKRALGATHQDLVSLREVLVEAWKASRWLVTEEQKGTFPEPDVQGDIELIGHRENLKSAFAGLFLHISDQAASSTVEVTATETDEEIAVICKVSAESDVATESDGATYQTTRDVDRILSEHGGRMSQRRREGAIEYQVRLGKQQE